MNTSRTVYGIELLNLSAWLLLIVCLTLLNTPARAGNTSVSDAGIRSLGSSLAYLAHCEMAKHVQDGTLANFRAALQAGLTGEAWQAVKNQYQHSLHEKQQYSISKHLWIPFSVNARNCASLEQALPLVQSNLLQDRK